MYDLRTFEDLFFKLHKHVQFINIFVKVMTNQWVINTQGRYKGGSHGLPPRKKKNTLFSLKNQNPTINLGAPL